MLDKKSTENNLRLRLTAQGLQNPRFAVVVPIVFEEQDPYLLIEVRAAGISQAGDPCFPGGKIEPKETPQETAAREMEEEIGVHVDPETFLGQLPTVRTRLGSNANVYVCMITQEQAADAVINPSEVAELLRVPISFFMKNPQAPDYGVEGHIIWGMTAGAIRHLCAVWKEISETR